MSDDSLLIWVVIIIAVVVVAGVIGLAVADEQAERTKGER